MWSLHDCMKYKKTLLESIPQNNMLVGLFVDLYAWRQGRELLSQIFFRFHLQQIFSLCLELVDTGTTRAASEGFMFQRDKGSVLVPHLYLCSVSEYAADHWIMQTQESMGHCPDIPFPKKLDPYHKHTYLYPEKINCIYEIQNRTIFTMLSLSPSLEHYSFKST